MATVFTKIINGEIPGRFVWADDQVVGFLSINPLGPGHTLVVPREEIDQWIDAPTGLFEHAMATARTIGTVIRDVFEPPRVALMIAGFEVPHLHVHVHPAWGLEAFDFSRAASDPDQAAMDDQAERIRAGLRAAGHGDHVPA
ncbi:HIT family protein [Actinomycetospora chiangmaiensis]|uniref:HIT family protein n=1 Tax=Actinomycetospora chiangmaiensis TaxID=402650 RepID=UPI000361103E|nr:HIT family protein [Actinomycetospora chiangmaiensis]